MIISKCWCWCWLITAFNSSSVSGIIFFLGNLLMLKRGGYCSLFAALFTKLNLRRSPSSLRASACCLSLINVGSRVGFPIVQGEVKGLKEFDQLITEESKLKKSHSAISFILKLCKVSSLFIFFLLLNWEQRDEMGATWGTLFNWGVSGWGIGRLCAGGLGGWSSRLEEAPSSPNPGHATKPLRGAPQPLISKFITSSGNLSSTEVLLWRLQDNRRLLWLPALLKCGNARRCKIAHLGCISVRIHFNFWTRTLSRPIYDWLLNRWELVLMQVLGDHLKNTKQNSVRPPYEEQFSFWKLSNWWEK